MRGLPPEQQLLIVLQAAAVAGLCIRLWTSGLNRVYVWFFRYLLALLLEAVGFLVPIRFDSMAYQYIFVLTEGINVCFYVLIVLELYSIVLRDLPGIASVSRRYIKLAITAAILLSALPLALERTPVGMVSAFALFERAVVLSLVVFILLISGFLLYYPIKLKRNVVVYSMGYAVYFLVVAGGLFAANVRQVAGRPLSDVLIATATACLVYWILMLRSQREDGSMVLGRHWSREEEELILSKLRSISATLARPRINNYEAHRR